jgi:hypothetical protein
VALREGHWASNDDRKSHSGCMPISTRVFENTCFQELIIDLPSRAMPLP